MVLGGDSFFKLPKGGDLKKELGKPCSRVIYIGELKVHAYSLSYILVCVII